MALQILLVVTLLFGQVISDIGNEGGIRLRVTSKGLDYLDRLASGYISAQVKSARIPDLTLPIANSAGRGYVNVSGTKIYGFRDARLQHHLSPPDQLEWTATVASLKVWGSWLLRFKTLWAVKGSGHFTINATDIRVRLNLTLNATSNGQLVLQHQRCQVDFGHFDVDLKGSLMAWGANLVAEKIESRLKEQLKSRVCEVFESAVVKANSVVKTDIVDISPQLSIDNRLVSPPAVSTGYIEAAARGEISVGRRWDVPFKPTSFRAISTGELKMAYLWVSDFVPNSLLWALHAHNKSALVVSKDLHPHLADYLATSCDTFCFGQLSPQLPTRFPNSHVSLLLQTVRAPEVTFSANEPAALTVALGLKAFLPPSLSAPVVSLVVHLHLELSPRLSGNRIFADFRLKMLKAIVTQSQVGVDVSQQQVDDILAEFLSPIIDVLLAEVNDKGVALPIPPQLSLVNPEFRLLDHILEIGTDLKANV